MSQQILRWKTWRTKLLTDDMCRCLSPAGCESIRNYRKGRSSGTRKGVDLPIRAI